MKNKNFLIIALIVIIIIFCITLITKNNQKNEILENKIPLEENTKEKNNNLPILAHFYCPNNISIDAEFYNNEPNYSVKLTLSDGRKYDLPQAISASGARYTNSDESFVFWNKGDTAFIMENGVMVLDNCSTKKSNKVETIKESNQKLTIKTSVDCKNNNGTWYQDNSTCEINSLSKEMCVSKGGVFNECNSACRHDPKAEICTMQCVLTCTFK